MCNLRAVLLFAAVLVLFTFPAHANLVVDGGFEDPVISSPYGFQYYSAITGWSVDTSRSILGTQGVIELQNGVAGAPIGNNLTELDAHSGSVYIYQDIPTVVGTQYVLSFFLLRAPAAYSGGLLVGRNLRRRWERESPGCARWRLFQPRRVGD